MLASEAALGHMLATAPVRRNPRLPTEAPRPPAGWNPDPTGRHQLRWWDGAAWTANAADDGVTEVRASQSGWGGALPRGQGRGIGQDVPESVG